MARREWFCHWAADFPSLSSFLFCVSFTTVVEARRDVVDSTFDLQTRPKTIWITYYTCIFFLLPPRKTRQRFIQFILDRLGCESDIFIRKFGFCSLSSLTTVVSCWSAATFVLCSVATNWFPPAYSNMEYVLYLASAPAQKWGLFYITTLV